MLHFAVGRLPCCPDLDPLTMDPRQYGTINHHHSLLRNVFSPPVVFHPATLPSAVAEGAVIYALAGLLSYRPGN
jgi:hypothetical protein